MIMIIRISGRTSKVENVETIPQKATSQANQAVGSAVAVGGISLFFLFLGLEGFGWVFCLIFSVISAVCAIGMGKMAYQDQVKRPQN
jgi:hypothetical protein